MQHVVSVLIVVMLLSACGDDDLSKQKIIRGKAASQNSIYTKSTVALMQGGEVFCSGTLVDRRFVVTAAHCLEGQYGNFQVGFGTRSGNFKTLPTKRFLMHPNYSGLTGWRPADIGMIELRSQAPNGFVPVSIAQGDLKKGDQLVLAGFGERENGRSGELYYTQVDVFRLMKNEGRVHEFSYNSRNGACFGDSGGPAFIKKGNSLEVVGATSRGTSEICSGEGIYTDIRYYSSFMEGFMGKEIDPKPSPKPKPEPTPDHGIGNHPENRPWCFSDYDPDTNFYYTIEADQAITVISKVSGKTVAHLGLNSYGYGETILVRGRYQPSFFFYQSGTGNRLFLYDDGHGFWLNHDGYSTQVPMQCDYGAIRYQ